MTIQGNGLAQVLNWRERPQESTPYGLIQNQQLQKYRQEQARRQAKDQAYEKARKEAEMNVSGLKHYLPDVQKGVNDINSSLHNKLNNAQDEFSINSAMAEHQPFINKEKQNIAEATKAEAAYAENKKDIDQGKFVNKDFANNLVHDKLLLEPDQETGRVNYGNIDYQGAYNWANHPGAHDYTGLTNDWANKLKTKFLEAQYTGEVPGVNGKFWEKQNDQYRFPVDEKGKLKPDFVNFAINQNPKNYDAALWTSIATKNNLDPTHDRSAIDKLFWEEKQKTIPAFSNGAPNPAYDPKAAEKQHEGVYKIFDNLLQQQQSHISIQNRQSEGHYPTVNGFGAQNQVPAISEGNITRVSKDADNVFKNGGLVAVEGPSVDLQNMLKSTDRKITLGDKTGDLIGFGPDPNTGNKSIVLRGNQNKFTGQYELHYAPFNEANRNAVVKYNTSLSPIAEQYSKMQQKDYHIDDQKVNEVVNGLKSAIASGKDDSDTSAKVQQYLNEKGIKIPADKIEVDKSKFGSWGTDDLNIDGKKFPMNEKGTAEFKRFIINHDIQGDNAQMQFIKDKNAKPETVNPEDFNTKWAKLKSGETLVGPDGKTYTKK